jgi:hypothetical protein
MTRRRLLSLTQAELAARWMHLSQAGERNARVLAWWESFHLRGNRCPRVLRMRGINRAAIRTSLVWGKREREVA